MGNIIPDKYYVKEEIVQGKFFPWATVEQTVNKFLKSQLELGNGEKYGITMKPGVNGPTGNRYFVKGSGIIRILAAFDDGSLFENK